MTEDALSRALRAWHGSPYDFEEFKNEAIGTGEGTRAMGGFGIRGHGHYVAEVRKVGEEYRDSLTRRRVQQPDYSYRFNGIKNSSSAGGLSEFLRHLYNVRDWERRMKQSKAMTGPLTDEETKKIVKEQQAELLTEIADLHRQAVELHGTPELMDLSLDQIQHLIDVDNDLRSDPPLFDNPEVPLVLSLRRRKDRASEAFRNNIFSRDDVKAEHDAAEKAYSVLLPIVNKMEMSQPQQPEGRLYELNLNLGEHELLDWDEILDNHHDEAMEKLANIPEIEDAYDGTQIGDATGEDLYKRLVMEHGTAVKASNRLLEHGIRGIRYKDQGSRDLEPVLHVNDRPFNPDNDVHKHVNLIARKVHREMGGKDVGHGDIEAAIDEHVQFMKSGAESGEIKPEAYERWKDIQRHVEQHGMKFEVKKPRPTYNYVIFDPTAIKIMRKLGMKGEVIKDFTDTGVHLKSTKGSPD